LARRLDWPRPLGASADSDLLAAAWGRWGPSLCEHLLGDYAFAVWDPRRSRLVVGRDALGVRPLYVFRDARRIVACSGLRGLLHLPGFDPTPRMDWLRAYLEADEAFVRDTPFTSVRRVPPATVIVFTPEDERDTRFWTPDPSRGAVPGGGLDDWADAVRHTAAMAVADRLRAVGPVAVESSGGLDSAGVVAHAVAATRTGRTLSTYTLVREDVEGVPPREAGHAVALDIAASLGIARPVTLDSGGRGLVRALERSVDIQARPSLGVWVTYDYLYDTVAANGSRVLLSGFGGDEAVSHRGYGFVHDLARHRWWRRLWLEILARHGGRLPAIRPFLGILLREVMGSGDPRDGRGVVAGRVARVTSPWTTERLECSAMAAAAAGIEYRHPLLDLRLVELALALPAHLEGTGGRARAVWRRSLRGLLPAEVLERETKGDGATPSSRARLERDRDRIRGLVDELLDRILDRSLDLGDMRRIRASALGLVDPPALGGGALGLGQVRRAAQVELFLRRLDAGAQDSATQDSGSILRTPG
ncbi:MAG TPA: asparagine synthase-related protein, partial [Longimicrobiales bacterium]